VKCIYLAESLEAAIAEAGKYKICDNAQNINRGLVGIRKPPIAWVNQLFKPLTNVEIEVASIEVTGVSSVIDLTVEQSALSSFTVAGQPHLKFNEINQNSYVSINNFATMKVGTFFYQQKSHLLKVPSARYPNSTCGVLFPLNDSSIKAQVQSRQIIKLYALDKNGVAITGNKIQPLNEDEFGYEIAGNHFKLKPLKL